MGKFSRAKYGILPQIGIFIIEQKNENDNFIINISEMRGNILGINQRSEKIETITKKMQKMEGKREEGVEEEMR